MPTFTGNNNNNTIFGTNGDDTIFGLGGNDNLFGLGGNDTIHGGTGHDNIQGNDGNDTLNGDDGNDTMSGGNGSDTMSGGSGSDQMSGDANDDNMSGGTGNDQMSGGSGNDTMAGDDGDDILEGNSGQDSVSGGAGADEIAGGGGNDTLTGDDGDDTLDGGDDNDSVDGGAGNDILFGGNGNDTLTGGGGYDLIYGGAGTDTAVYSGSILEYDFYNLGFMLGVVHNGGAGADGADLLLSVEKLQFADATIDLTQNNAPIAFDDSASTDEEAGTYSSGTASVLDNDFDFEGDNLTVTQAVIAGAYGTLTMNSDGTYSYALNANAQTLAQGEIGQDSFSYTVSDGSLSDTGTLTINITGANDAPVANADSASGGENEVILIDVLANDTDVDNGAVLTVTAASAPAGQGSASVAGNQVQFDPGGDFDELAAGESEEVAISYAIEDEHGAGASATIIVTVNGANDGPVANPDDGTTDENAILTVDVLANDSDVDNGAVLTVTAASAPAGQGSAAIVGNQVQFDPGTDFDDLAVGESEEVVVSYDIADEHGATSSSTITILVTGSNDGPVANPDSATTSEEEVVTVDVLANDTDADNGAVLTVTAATAPAGQGTASVVGNQVQFDPGSDFDNLSDGESAEVIIDYVIEDEHGAQSASTLTIIVEGQTTGTITGTNEGETIIGTPGDDRINALGGDDIVFGLAGNDFIRGGDGADTLNGEGDNDSIEGGDGDDIVSGGDGFDTLNGEAGNDNLSGGNDGDVLSGGEDDDQLFGQAGDDALRGDEGDDQLFGGDGFDDLNGGSGNDSLAGGTGDDSVRGDDGDDSLDGGDGNDFLSDFAGTNSFTGGLGDDNIEAGSTDGAQTIDGGDGNDTIRHYYRHNASSITTGSGSDTIEIAHADQGSAAITVTDFTAGAGGDMFRLSGDDGALLGLLIGWDGSSNPFGTGHLRLEQSGADTLLQWDRNGSDGGAEWETLAVFQNSDAGDFTDANFVPGYHPDGSPPQGQTINGTNGSETLNGTIGSDTINAFGGNDTVNGNAGADTINGGDGADQLNGDADDDIIDGGNDDDIVSGGDGNDQLFGQAGNDIVFGGLGDDEVSGGTGDDSLNGVEGDDTLTGGDGNDFLTDLSGTNSLDGGAGDDRIDAGSSDGAQTILGGAGSDTIRHFYRHAASIITTGGDSDTIEIAYADQGNEAIIVTDFTPGAGGDVFRLTGEEGSLLSLLQGWDGSSNPFGTFLRLHQEGDHVQLEWDQDGEGAGADWQTLAIFQNTSFDDFTADNFDPSYPPGGDPPAGETITGTEDDDVLVGTIGDDTINALGGGDSVFGLDGADIINGGDGLDNLNGGAGNDIIDGGNDDDTISGNEGNDELLGQGGNDIVFGEDGDDELSGGDGLDNLNGDAGNDIISGGNEADFLSGGGDNDTLDGGAGGDFLSGGPGSDVMTGGADADVFDFASASDGPDEIIDFAGGIDKIQVSADGFGGGLVSGGGVSLVSGSDPTASDNVGQFLFDTDDGRLFWDADGTGEGEAVLIATLSNVPPLDASDFLVV